MSRPKNEEIGKPLRDRRIPVQVTPDEYDELSAAAEAQGMPVSSFLRWAALREARRSNGKD